MTFRPAERHEGVGPSSLLDCLDAGGLRDLRTFAGRARQLEPAGVLRWQSGGGLVVLTVRARAGEGLLGRGMVLGMRVLAAPRAPEADIAVSLTRLLAGLREATAEGPLAPVPPSDRAATWVGLAPPRGGWALLAQLRLDGSRDDPSGALALAGLVGATTQWLPEASARNAAGALYALGFLPRGTTSVSAFGAGRWTRLSTVAGHVLVHQ